MKRKVAFLACIVAALAAVFLVCSWMFIDWGDEGSDEYPGGTILRDSSGRILRVTLGPGDVDCRPFYAASPDDWIVKALVAAEDSSFWSHRGVRPMSVLRAAWQNVSCRRRISGASTITMQAVRLLRPHPKNLWWKWKEAVKAAKMERAKPKQWIISQYLNRAPFGSNFVGIEAASQGWFGKGAKDLGLGEAAMLARRASAPTNGGAPSAMHRRSSGATMFSSGCRHLATSRTSSSRARARSSRKSVARRGRFSRRISATGTFQNMGFAAGGAEWM